LAKEGYDPKFGARPMRRLIEREIKKPLVDAILFGDLQNGGTAKVEAPAADVEPANKHLRLVPTAAPGRPVKPPAPAPAPAD
jgi:ATP-dependent Clp protease ATP-binding subunit ClpA